MPTKNDPNALVAVVWSETGEKVKLPRRLLSNGSKQAQLRHLIATGQVADPAAPPLPEMQEPKEVMQAVVDDAATKALERRLAALESRPAAELPSDAALAEWSRQAQRVALSHQELNALTEATVNTCEAAAQGAEQRLADLDGQQQAMLSSVSEAVSEGQEAVASAVQSLEQRGAEALSDIEQQALTSAQEIARRQRGPQGLAGSGTTVCPEDPSEVSNFGERWFGRALVPGDAALQTTENGLIAHRYVGDRWVKSAELLPKVVTATGPSILDRSVKNSNSIQIVQPGGGGGGGGLEKFLISTLGQGSYADLASNANWASAGYDSRAGELWIEVLNPATGLSGVVACVFDVGLNATETRLTEFALTGRLFEGAVPPDVDLDVIRGGIPPIPPSVTAVTNIGTAHTIVRVRVGANVGGSANYIIRGGIVWLQQAQGIAIPNDQNGPRPNWTWG